MNTLTSFFLSSLSFSVDSTIPRTELYPRRNLTTAQSESEHDQLIENENGFDNQINQVYLLHDLQPSYLHAFHIDYYFGFAYRQTKETCGPLFLSETERINEPRTSIKSVRQFLVLDCVVLFVQFQTSDAVSTARPKPLFHLSSSRFTIQAHPCQVTLEIYMTDLDSSRPGLLSNGLTEE